LLDVAMLDGGGFRLDPGVLAWVVGVEERMMGVFDRAAGGACCLEVRPLADVYFAAAGELDRVDTGLARPEGAFIFLTRTGSREVGDVGDASLLCLVVALSLGRRMVCFDPAASLFAREWFAIAILETW
jgi:hypothetical protein